MRKSDRILHDLLMSQFRGWDNLNDKSEMLERYIDYAGRSPVTSRVSRINRKVAVNHTVFSSYTPEFGNCAPKLNQLRCFRRSSGKGG